MAKVLKATRFGNPILRKIAKPLTVEEIVSDKVQTLIGDMRYTLAKKEYGVGLAAPQVGKSIALSVIGIKPTPNHPEFEVFETVIINPEIIEKIGEQKPMWEGCISCGTNDDTLFAQLPRFEKVKVRWIDEDAKPREEIVDGFVAHVMQHEIDHLNGILFVDHVTDPKTYMMSDEYRKRILGK